ncbi:hypothetical protein ACTJKN_08770 [Pedobacter sp. 22163]
MQVPMDNTFLENMAKLWWLFAAGCLSLIAYITLERFKTRISIFTSTILFNSVGTSLKDNVFGDIKVTHNDRNINHLNFIEIIIANPSNSDFENVNLLIWVDHRSQILGWTANYQDSGIAFNLEKEFIARSNSFDADLKAFRDEHPSEDLSQYLMQELMFTQANKTFNLPVFNRKTSIKLNLLVENFDGNIPKVSFDILHKSIKVIPAQDDAKTNSKTGLAMIIYGYVLLTIFCIYIFNKQEFTNLDKILLTILAFLHLWVGLLIYKVIGYVKSILR